MGKKYIVSMKNIDAEHSEAEVSPAKTLSRMFQWGRFFIGGLWFILILAFISFSGIIIVKNFPSREQSVTEINVCLELPIAKDKENLIPNKAAIDALLENTAKQSFYLARKEAQEEYDKNFTLLLTVLTIFGIAWPVMIALLQFRFSESELQKIQEANAKAEDSLANAKEANAKAEDSLANAKEANAKAEDSLRKAREANTKAEESLANAKVANAKAEDSLKKIQKMQAIAYRVFSQQYYDMGYDKKKSRSQWH